MSKIEDATRKAVKKAEDRKLADQIESKKTTRKAAAKTKAVAEKAGKVVEAVKTPSTRARVARTKIIIQSPMGGAISTEEIVKKLPKGVDMVFVRVDQNKLWWVRGEETGSEDIW